MKLKDIKYRLRIKEAEELLADWKRKGDILIVPLKGELDHHQADKVRDFLDRLLEDASIRHLILDLSDLFLWTVPASVSLLADIKPSANGEARYA